MHELPWGHWQIVNNWEGLCEETISQKSIDFSFGLVHVHLKKRIWWILRTTEQLHSNLKLTDELFEEKINFVDVTVGAN